MKYSVFTVSMPEYPVEKVPTTLAKWGYDGVEWRVVDQQSAPKPSFWRGNRATIMESEALERAGEIKKLTRDGGLVIMGLGTYCDCGANRKRLSYLMETARAMGTRNLRIGTPHFDGSKSYAKMFKKAQKDYERVAKCAEEFKVRANVEMHPNTLTPSASAARRLLEPFDPKHVGVIYDVGNLVREGFERYRMGLEVLGKYLNYIHLKSGLWRSAGKDADGATVWAYKAASLKAGQPDMGEFLGKLAQVGYDGWISIEDFSSGSSLSRLKNGVAYLRTLERRVKKAKSKK